MTTIQACGRDRNIPVDYQQTTIAYVSTLDHWPWTTKGDLLFAVQCRECHSTEFLRKVTSDSTCAGTESLRSIDVSPSFQSFSAEHLSSFPSSKQSIDLRSLSSATHASAQSNAAPLDPAKPPGSCRTLHRFTKWYLSDVQNRWWF